MIIKNENIISFTKVKLPYGWLSNMSNHKVLYKDPNWYNGKENEFYTAEALFQALRFDDINIISSICRESNPMKAKRIAKSNIDKMIFKNLRRQDISNMIKVVKLKLQNNPYLKQELINTGNSTIIEDVSNRLGGSSIFWGAALIQDLWIGENVLGKIWMSTRKNLKNG